MKFNAINISLATIQVCAILCGVVLVQILIGNSEPNQYQMIVANNTGA